MKTNFFGEILALMTSVILLWLFVTVVGYPETVGRWLQKIDTARYEMIDCDCTEPLE